MGGILPGTHAWQAAGPGAGDSSPTSHPYPLLTSGREGQEARAVEPYWVCTHSGAVLLEWKGAVAAASLYLLLRGLQIWDQHVEICLIERCGACRVSGPCVAPLKPAVAANDWVAQLGWAGPSVCSFTLAIAIEVDRPGWGYGQRAVGGGLRYCRSDRGKGQARPGRLWGGAASSGSPKTARRADRDGRRGARGRLAARLLGATGFAASGVRSNSGQSAGRAALLFCCASLDSAGGRGPDGARANTKGWRPAAKAAAAATQLSVLVPSAAYCMQHAYSLKQHLLWASLYMTLQSLLLRVGSQGLKGHTTAAAMAAKNHINLCPFCLLLQF